MGSNHNADRERHVSSSEDEADDNKQENVSRKDSVESGIVSFSNTADKDDTANGHTNKGFTKK